MSPKWNSRGLWSSIRKKVQPTTITRPHFCCTRGGCRNPSRSLSLPSRSTHFPSTSLAIWAPFTSTLENTRSQKLNFPKSCAECQVGTDETLRAATTLAGSSRSIPRGACRSQQRPGSVRQRGRTHRLVTTEILARPYRDAASHRQGHRGLL